MGNVTFNDLLNLMPEGCLVCGAGGEIVSANTACREILFQDTVQMEGAMLADLFEADSRAVLADYLAGLEAGPGPAGITVSPAWRTGGRRYLKVTGRLLPEGWDAGNRKAVLLYLADITGEVQENRALRISEEKYWAMMNFSGDAILVFDHEGTIADANLKALTLFGYSRKSLLGADLEQLYPSDQYQQQAGIFNEILLLGAYSVSDIDIVNRDGRRIPVDITGSVLEYGEKSLIQIIFRDITEKKRAEMALRESEERYRKLVELAPEVIGVHVDGKLAFLNETGIRLGGFGSLDDAIGFDVLRLIHPDDRAGVIERIRRIFATGEKLAPVRERMITLQGETIYAESNSVVFDYMGSKAMLFYTRDISDKVKAEEALRNSEETNRALLNATPDRIALIDPHGNMLAVNDTIVARAGKTAEEMIENSVWPFLPEETARSRKEKVRQVVEEGKPLSFTDEEIGRVISSSLYPIKAPNGTVTRIAVFARDITEQINMEAEKMRLLSELNQIFNISTIGLCLIKGDCTILRANNTYHRMFGYVWDIAGHRCDELQDGDGCKFKGCLLDGDESEEKKEYEISCFRDGSECNYLVSETMFYNPRGIGIGVLRSVADITTIRRLEKELISISDRERQLIGQDLHDEIGQVMTGMAFMIEKLEKRMKKKNYPEAPMVAEINELNTGAINRMRDIIKGLAPVLLSENDLMPALAQLAGDARRLFGTEISFPREIHPDGLEAGDATQIFYIIRESVHNAIKHARASRIDVQFSNGPAGYEIVIFNDSAVQPHRTRRSSDSMGLNIMKYRAQMIGAELSAESVPGGYLVKLRRLRGQ